MAVGDDAMEDYVTSLRPSTGGKQQNGSIISPEVAWADSCLINDPASDSCWDSFRDALSEALGSQVDSDHVERHDSSPKAEHKVIELSEESGSSVNALTSEGAEKTDNDSNEENVDSFWSKVNMENVFRPTYDESVNHLGKFDQDSDSDSDSGFPAFVIDQSNEDIFKVWDLDTPDEEDELVKQLNKALTESSLEPSPSVSDDPTLSKELKGVDDLISGLADLSLIEDSV